MRARGVAAGRAIIGVSRHRHDTQNGCWEDGRVPGESPLRALIRPELGRHVGLAQPNAGP